MFWSLSTVRLLFGMLFFFAAASPANSMRGATTSEDDTVARSIVFIDVKGGESCSGVVFRRDEIITAAHCVVEEGNRRVAPSRVTVYYTQSYTDDRTTFRKVERIIVNPAFELGQKEGAIRLANHTSLDIAILKLSGSHPPRAVSAIVPEDARRIGQHTNWRARQSTSYVAVYGFGETDGKRNFILRTGKMLIDSVFSGLPYLEGRARLTGAIARDGKKTALCRGDSGGGVFYVKRKLRTVMLLNGKPLLAGIVVSSRSQERCSIDNRMINAELFSEWLLAH